MNSVHHQSLHPKPHSLALPFFLCANNYFDPYILKPKTRLSIGVWCSPPPPIKFNLWYIRICRPEHQFWTERSYSTEVEETGGDWAPWRLQHLLWSYLQVNNYYADYIILQSRFTWITPWCSYRRVGNIQPKTFAGQKFHQTQLTL